MGDPRRKRNSKRRPMRRRNRTNTVARPSIPIALVRGAKLLRSVQLCTRLDTTSWIDNLLYFGVYALKLYLADYLPIQKDKKIPVGSLQSMTITLDDLLVGSAFTRTGVEGDGSDQWRCQFCKAKLNGLSIKLLSTAAPSHRSGRMGLSFIWFSEAEALEAVDDLKHRQTAVLPDLKRFFQIPGIMVSSVSGTISRTWTPPAGSWVRDFIRIGRSSGRGSGSAWGLPIGRVIVGYQNLDASEKATSYVTEDTSLMLEFGAKVDLAELGDRILRKSFAMEYDATSFGVYSESGNYEVPATDWEHRAGRFLKKPSALPTPTSPTSQLAAEVADFVLIDKT